jgi:hypothetical protein
MATTDIYHVVGSINNSKPALRFLGGNVDDGVTVNALGAAMCAGNHTKGTISAWIMIPNNYTAAMTIMSFGDNNVATEYVAFTVTTAGKLQFIIVDGATMVDVSTTNKVIYPFKWYHVAIVQNAVAPKIYVNGVSQALTYATTTEITQWFDDLDGIDNACIGALYSNNLYTQEFMGYITNVRVWSGTTDAVALTDEEILADYNGAVKSGGLAHYGFDGDVLDDWTGSTTYAGTIVGAIIYVVANEFFCRFSYGCGIPVTADNVVMCADNGTAMAVVIQQA